MAFGGHELLLIVRAQNQASQALRRVAADTARLGSIRDLHLRQNQLAINQSRLMTSRQRALNELQAIEGAQGARNLSLQRRTLSNQGTQLGQLNQLERAQSRYMKLVRSGVSGRALQQASRDVQRYQKALAAAQVGGQQLTAEEQRMAQRAQILRQQLDSTNSSLAQNVAEQKDLAKQISRQRWDRLQTGARIATHLGRVMQMAGLVGGAALGFLAKTAADYNSQVTLVATQTGPVGSTFQRVAGNAGILQKALLGVMRQGTATRDELTAAAYDIFSSLTLPGKNIQQLGTGVAILKQLNKASIAGATSLTDVTNAVIATLGAFKEIQPTGHNVEKLLQRMFAAVRFGRFTFAEFSQVLGTAAPAARAAGQTFNTLAGTIAFLSRPLGINKAAIGFARLTEILSRAKMVQGLKDLGVNITNAQGKLLQLPQVIDRITTKFPNLTKGGVALTQFFKKVSGTEGTIQARRAFVFLAQQLDRYRLVLHQTTSDNNEFSRSFDAMSKTAGVRFGIFINRLKAFAIVIGEAVLPSLLKLSKPIEDLTNWFESLDAAQRKQIGKWATYVAALLLFGGTVVAVGGMILSFIAVMGGFGFALPGITIVLLAVVAAVKILNGEWRSLADAINTGVDTMLGSFKGFIAMSALVVVAALKMRTAFLGLASMRLAMVGGAAGGAETGLLAGIGGAFTTGRLAAMYKAEAGASRLSASLSGAAAGAAALPGPLKIAAAAIGLAAGAALLWKLHMSGVRAHAERIARFQAQVQAIGAAPGIAAKRAGSLGIDAREVVRAKLAVADLNAQIKQTRKDIAASNAAQRPGLQRQLTGLILDRADALNNLNVQNQNANASFDAMSKFVQKQGNLLQALGNAHRGLITSLKNIKKHSDEVKTSMTGTNLSLTKAGQASPAFNKATEAAANFRSEINTLSAAANNNALKMRRSFGRVVTDLQRAQFIPKVSPTAFNAMLNTMVKRGGRITIPQMRAIIKAVADPASLRQMPKDIQRAVRQAKVQIKVETQKTQAARDLPAFAKTLGKFIPAIQIRTKTDLATAHSTKNKAASIFKKAINQPIHLGPVQPSAISLGLSIANGVAQGVYAGGPAVNTAVASIVASGIAAGQKKAKSKSPSKETRDKIGIPLVQGISVGILSQLGLIERSARLAIDAFNGPWLSSDRFSQSKKKVKIHVADLIKDLNMQLGQFKAFNTAMASLARRGVPLALLDQLSQLGAAGAGKIAKLANASAPQLRRYVSLWRQAMRQIQISQRSSFDTIVSDLHNFVNDAAQNLLGRWNDIRDQLQSNWAELFVGLDEKIGDGFKSALDTWQSNVDDLQGQVKDLTDQVKGWFGDLFQGAVIASDRVQNKLNWGIALNMDDLTKDLQSQLDVFKAWTGNLASLAGRVPPELLNQLRDLGPSAAAEISALAHASAPELANYVALWQQTQDAIGKAAPTLFQQIATLITQINNLLANKPKALTGNDLIKGIQDQASAFTQFTGLLDALQKKKVPQELLAQLAALGPDALPVLQALNSMTGAQLTQYVGLWTNMQKTIDAETTKLMKNQIAAWKQHGADIAAGIIAGVMSEQETLLKFFRKLFLNLLTAARKQVKAHSPSKVYADLGSDIMAGLKIGLESGAGMRVPMPGVGRASLAGSGQTINMTVHAHQDESLMTTLQRASFRLRNRRV